MKRLLLSCFFGASSVVNVTCQEPETTNLRQLYTEKKYNLLEKLNTNNTSPHYYFYKAVYANVCNNPTASGIFLDTLERSGIPEDITYKYWCLRYDNYIKLSNYPKALYCSNYIIAHFKDSMSVKEFETEVNNRKIWEAVKDEPGQEVLPFQKCELPYTRDAAQLMNIEVQTGGISSRFVFDTGAAISSIQESTAKKLGLRIFEHITVEIHSFSGVPNKAKMGIADELRIGNVVVKNALFLVFRDEALTFANGAYKIEAIIGFPIAKEMGTIAISKKTIAFNKSTSTIVQRKNMFVDGLSPLVLLNFNGHELPFCFDTGARESFFSKLFYNKYEPFILARGKKTTATDESVGGKRTYEVFRLKQLDMGLSEKMLRFSPLKIDKDNYHILGNAIYGNIGQDVIKQYKKVIMSFDQNYLEFTND